MQIRKWYSVFGNPIPPPLINIIRSTAFILLIVYLPQVGARPRSQPVLLGDSESVISSHPVLGVHTRLTDEVEPWKIKRTLQLVREMGATSIVEFFPCRFVLPRERCSSN